MAARQEVMTQGYLRGVVALTILLALLMLAVAACSTEINSSDPGTPDKTPAPDKTPTGPDSGSKNPVKEPRRFQKAGLG
jgi:hypothetical protein